MAGANGRRSRRIDVIATFDDSGEAERALDRLSARGIAKEEVSVLVADRGMGRRLVVAARRRLPEGAAIGAIVGAAIGTAVVVAIPAVAHPLVAAVEATRVLALVFVGLAGAGAGGALGWVIGGIAGLGFDIHEVRHIREASDQPSPGGPEHPVQPPQPQQHRHRGHVVIGVRVDSETKAATAQDVFERGGATSIVG